MSAVLEMASGFGSDMPVWGVILCGLAIVTTRTRSHTCECAQCARGGAVRTSRVETTLATLATGVSHMWRHEIAWR